MRTRFLDLAVAFLLFAGAAPALAQTSPAPGADIEALREEIRRLRERLERLERQPPSASTSQPAGPTPAGGHPPSAGAGGLPTSPGSSRPGAPALTGERPTTAPPAPAAAPTPPAAPGGAPPVAITGQVAPAPGEREISLEREHIFETIGLGKPHFGSTMFSGFFVGSASYNTHVQMVPEFAGGGAAQADPGSLNFRFDKFGLAVSRTFAAWLSAGAAIEVESHRDRHTHLIGPLDPNRRGCPPGLACERFGAEAAETEVTLDKFHLTAIAPLGNGLALSFGRFDVPFGIERHDEPLLLTATASEVFRFGRPQRMTGLMASYQFAPWLDLSVWGVNRWESETTHDPFDDNNRDKSFGGRLGFTPLARDGLLNVGLGAFWGPEQTDVTSNSRWVIDLDVTWSPLPRLLLAGEVVFGREERVTTRQVGLPIPMAAGTRDREWWGFYVLGHYDVVDWLGLTLRYGYFDDRDGGRTGVEQVLQSITVAPVVHLSRLIPDLRPTGAVYPRTRHPIHWVDLKFEYRFNVSDRPVFSDARPNRAILTGDDTSHQLQLQLVVNF